MAGEETGWLALLVRPTYVTTTPRPLVFRPPAQPVPQPLDTYQWLPTTARQEPRPAHAYPRGRAYLPSRIINDPSPAQAVGSAGSGTFAIAVESGAQVVYSWLTDVHQAWSGKETRHGLLSLPRQRYEFSSVLTNAQQRSLLSTLAGNAATGPTYLLGLAFEDLTIVSSTSSAITLHPGALALCDWAVPGQRVIIVTGAGVTGATSITTVGASTLGTLSDVSATAIAGARIMPAVPVLLEPDQTIGRHRRNMGTWEMKARALSFHFGSSSTPGTGASVTTYTDPDDATVSWPVWDRGVATDLAAQPLRSGHDIIDLGSLVSSAQMLTESDWNRTVRIESSSRAEWQWFKAFLDDVQGRRVSFLLPTGRPDLILASDASTGTLTVTGPPTTGATDYVADWFPSLAHRFLKLVKSDGTIAYRKVTAATGTATQSLVLDSALAGALDHVEFLEIVRLDSDDVPVTWHGPAFECSLTAKVVQQEEVTVTYPESGADWADIEPLLGSPTHRWGMQDSGDPLDNSIAAGQDLVYTGGSGDPPEYGKAAPNISRLGVGFPSVQTLNPTLGYWTDDVGGLSLNTGDSTGAVLVFALIKQNVTSNPGNVRIMLEFNGTDCQLGVGSLAGTDMKTRFRVGSLTLTSSDESHNDGMVHAYLFQAYEDATNIYASLVTDVETLDSSAVGGVSNAGAVVKVFMSEVSGNPNAANFDYFDMWMWRGVVLTPTQMEAVMTTMVGILGL